MKRVFAANEGFRRRVTKHFTFDAMTPLDIARVMRLKMETAAPQSPLFGFRLDAACSDAALEAEIEAATTEEQRAQRNGGMALPVLMDARDCLDARLDLNCTDPEELTTISIRDIAEALQMI